MNPEDRLDQASAPDPVGRRYSRPPAGSPPRPRARSPFWAVITAANPPAYSWEEVEWSAPGTWAAKDGGRTSAEFGSAYEANTFDFTEAGINPVAQVILLHELRTGDAAEYRFHYGPMADTEADSTWGTITDNADAPTYVFDGDNGWGGEATEVNGVKDIAEGTRVRIFRTVDEGEDLYAFEYDGDSVGVLEDSFDFIEVWPALVVTADASPLHARLWIPGGGFPPAVADNWHLTAAEATEHVAYDQVGEGTFSDGTLVPCLADYDAGPPEVADWIQVRCQPGAFVTEAPTEIPDGAIVTFTHTLADAPLPYTFTFEYEVAPGRWKRLISTRTVAAATDFKVDLQGPGTGWYKVRAKTYSVTLQEAPPAGATVRARYIPVGQCAWSWLATPETVEGGELQGDAAKSTIGQGWLFVDEDRKVAHGSPRAEVLHFPTGMINLYVVPYFDDRGHYAGTYTWNAGTEEWDWETPFGIAGPDPPA